MRGIYLLPLTGLVITVVACRSTEVEQATRSVPKRDLTLVMPPRAVETASPIETATIRAETRATRHSRTIARVAKTRHPTPTPTPKLTDQWVPTLVLASPRPPIQPANTAATPTNDRELPPGKTVTLIPASSGPTADPGGTDDGPAAAGRAQVGHRGGRCGGRGMRPGAAPAPRPDFR
jgi:hypothetical protein